MVTTDNKHEIIYDQQLKLVADAMPTSLIAILINGTLLAALQSSVLATELVAGWYLAVLLVSASRYMGYRRYLAESPEERNPIYWGNLFFFGTVLSAVVWGSAAYFLFPLDSQPHQLFLTFVLAGMVTGAVTTLSSINLYFQSFAMLALLPLAARFVQLGETIDLAMAGMIVLFLVMVSSSAVRSHRTILHSLKLAYEHERAHEALDEAGEQNRLLLESAAEGIFGVDINGNTTFVNPSAAAILGYEPHEMLNKPMHKLIHHHRADGSPYPVEECPMSNTLRTGNHNFINDEVLWHKDGHSIPVEYHSTPILKSGEVVGVVITFSDISQRIEAESQLEYQAYYDALTGLANRRLLLDRLEQALTLSRRHRHMGGLLLLDLDNFKTINDSLGHAVGDELLIIVAERLKKAIRTEDTVARMGGDDFVILLAEVDDDPDRTAKAVQEIADKCRETLSRPFAVQGRELHVTSSIGAVLFPMGEETADDLLKQADTAMYRAKEGGRDTIQFFLPSMQQAVEQRMHLYNDLRLALKQDQFELHYQPQYNRKAEIIGAEALLRWSHPVRGMVSPAEFIPLAEESGLILPIGEWVLMSACRLVKQLESEGDGHALPTLAVNVSPRQFQQPDFVQQVERALQQTGVDGSRIELELTEGILVHNVDETIAKMEALRQLGITFSIDDFGTGYSSLTYLQRLPLHKLKVDQSFVRNLDESNRGAVLAETIIDMGTHLNLEVIAEGVETDEQFHTLCKMGCEQFQGYLFSRPVEEETLRRLLMGEGEAHIC